MRNGVPDGWLSRDRSHWLATGADEAAGLVDSVFPPRAEDKTGTLAVATVEVLSSRAIRTSFTAPDRPGDARRWWLEGFISGYCAQAAQALTRASDVLETDVFAELAQMMASVVPKLSPDQADAASVVFALVEACLRDDEVAAAWAVEHLFVPAGDVEVATVSARVLNVCNAAVLTCCASWQLLLVASRDC